MSARRSCPPAPGPLEAFAVQFDPLFQTLAQRHGFRTYLSGLLLPRDRSKTLTALVGAEPLVQAQAAEVQRLQFFLSESTWDADRVNAQRLALLADEPVTSPSADGVLIIDDTGDRKDGSATDHVARQCLASVGKIDNGIVAVTISVLSWLKQCSDRGPGNVELPPVFVRANAYALSALSPAANRDFVRILDASS